MLCYPYFDNVNVYYEEVTIYASIARQMLLHIFLGTIKIHSLDSPGLFLSDYKKEKSFINASRIKIATKTRL